MLSDVSRCSLVLLLYCINVIGTGSLDKLWDSCRDIPNITTSRPVHAYTADDSRAPPLLTHRRKCGRLRRSCVSRGRRHEMLLLCGTLFLHWVNMSHLSSQVEPSWCLACWTVLHWIAASGMFLGYSCACIQLRPRHARAPLRCSGGTLNLGVDAGLCGRLSSSLHAKIWRLVLSTLFRPSYGVG